MATTMDDVRKTLSKQLEDYKRQIASMQAEADKVGKALILLGGPVPTGKDKTRTVSPRGDTNLPNLSTEFWVGLLTPERWSFDQVYQAAVRKIEADLKRPLTEQDAITLRQRTANTLVRLRGEGKINSEGKKRDMRYWAKPAFPLVPGRESVS